MNLHNQITNVSLNAFIQSSFRQNETLLSTLKHLALFLHSSLKCCVYLVIVIKQISVQFSCSVISNSLWPHGLHHARPPCPSPTPRACSNSCPLSWWCHPTISSSIVPFSSCLQSFPASGSFPMRWLFTSRDQSIGASASVLLINISDWFPLGLTGLISLLSKGLSRVFSNTTVQKHQLFIIQLSL